jgi:Putative auto-transporter adhesin, head GIN domain
MQLKSGIALSALLVLSGCDGLVIGAGSTITGSGVPREEKREVDAFKEVEVSAMFEAAITVGPECSVTLDVDDNLMPLARTTVADGRLEVNFADGSIIIPKKPPRVSIVMPCLDVIVSRAAAKVIATGMKGKSIAADVSGAASVELKELSVDSVDVKEDGAARVTLEGKGKALTFEASGASRLMAAGATFESAKVAIAGASRCEVNVTASIAGEVSGASSLYVYGNPASRSVKAFGSSRVTY